MNIDHISLSLYIYDLNMYIIIYDITLYVYIHTRIHMQAFIVVVLLATCEKAVLVESKAESRLLSSAKHILSFRVLSLSENYF